MDLQQIYHSVIVGVAPRVKRLVERAVGEKVPASEIISGYFIPAMTEVGARFERQEFYVPEMLIAARAMQTGLGVLKPLLVEGELETAGQVVIGTVKGDLHDIGKNLVSMMLDTGIRASELTGLRISDLHLEEGYMKVLGKGRRERIVPLGYTSQRALWKYLRKFRSESALPTIDRVFLTRDGQPMKIDWLYKVVSRACRRAGIDGKRIGPHTCRHTFARQFLMNGGDLLTLQRILGHSSLDVVRLYVNLDTRDLLQQQRRYSPIDALHSKVAS